MGMELTYRRMPASEWTELESDPERALTFLFAIPGFDLAQLTSVLGDPEAMKAQGKAIFNAFKERQKDSTRVDIGKDWQALHFLLTGDPSLGDEHRTDDPLHNVVSGGRPTGVDADYGPVRLLQGEDLKATADALHGVAVESLREKFSAEEFNAAEIYPCRGGWDEDEIESVFHIFPKLQRFFAEACEQDEVVVLYLH